MQLPQDKSHGVKGALRANSRKATWKSHHANHFMAVAVAVALTPLTDASCKAFAL